MQVIPALGPIGDPALRATTLRGGVDARREIAFGFCSVFEFEVEMEVEWKLLISG